MSFDNNAAAAAVAVDDDDAYDVAADGGPHRLDYWRTNFSCDDAATEAEVYGVTLRFAGSAAEATAAGLATE